MKTEKIFLMKKVYRVIVLFNFSDGYSPLIKDHRILNDNMLVLVIS